jgi:hypothetical protein
MNSGKAIKGDPLPDSLRKEIRRLIAVVIYCNIVCERAGDCSQKEQEDMMFKYYVGGKGEDSVSYVDMFLKGQGDFDFLFETYKEGLPPIKKLKSMFARTEKTHILGIEISKAALEQVTTKQLKIVTGRYLLSAAKEALSGVRQSMSFLEKYLDTSSGSPKASAGTSGWEEIDVVNKWLDDYHQYLKSDKDIVALEDTPSDAENEDHDEQFAGTIHPDGTRANNDVPANVAAIHAESGTSSKSEELMKTSIVRPDGWLFPGILAVLLYGPFKQNVDARRTLNFMKFYDDLDSDQKKKGGRDALRTAKKQQDDFERSREAGRGLSKETQFHAQQIELSITGLKMQAMSQQLQRRESALLSNSVRISQLREHLKFATENRDIFTNAEIQELKRELEISMKAFLKKSDELEDIQNDGNNDFYNSFLNLEQKSLKRPIQEISGARSSSSTSSSIARSNNSLMSPLTIHFETDSQTPLGGGENNTV